MYAIPFIALVLVTVLANYVGYRSLCRPTAKSVQAGIPEDAIILWLHAGNGTSTAYELRPDGTCRIRECEGLPY